MIHRIMSFMNFQIEIANTFFAVVLFREIGVREYRLCKFVTNNHTRLFKRDNFLKNC